MIWRLICLARFKTAWNVVDCINPEKYMLLLGPRGYSGLLSCVCLVGRHRGSLDTTIVPEYLLDVFFSYSDSDSESGKW